MKFPVRLFLAVTLTVVALLGLAEFSHAQGPSEDIQKQVEVAARAANIGDPVDPRVTVAFIIRAFLGLTTMVLIILNIYAGFTWMTAGGNEEKVTTAKTTIRNSTIGLIIVLSAYSITLFATYIARGQQYGLGGGPNAATRFLGNVFQSREGTN